jgi:hypothetical protein
VSRRTEAIVAAKVMRQRLANDPERPFKLGEYPAPTKLTGIDLAGHGADDYTTLVGTLTTFEDAWQQFAAGTRVGSSANRATGWQDERGRYIPHRLIVGAQDDDPHGVPDPPWRLAYLHFRHSGKQNLMTWWSKDLDEQIAKDMGFAPGPDGYHKPSYERAHRWFKHLEINCVEAFEQLHRRLLHLIAENDPQAFRYLYVDGTEVATWAKPVHDCRPGEPCRGNLHGRRLGKFARAPRLTKANAMEAANRRAQNTDAGKTAVGEHQAVGDARLRATGKVDKAVIVGRETGNGYRYYLRIRTAGHWYLIADMDAGVRQYDNAGQVLKAWVGGQRIPATCVRTGLTTACIHTSAASFEPNMYDSLLNKAEAATGRSVLAFTTDKAGSLNRIYYEQARRGRAVISEITSHPKWKTADYDTVDWDRHEWRCPSCRHEARRVGNAIVARSDGSLAVKFRCAVHAKPDCGFFERTITRDNALRLGLMPRLHPAHLALNFEHKPGGERPHNQARQRHNIAAKVHENVPQRVGDHVQYTYSLVALIYDATKYCLRMGYLNAPAGLGKPVRRATPTEVNLIDLHAALHEATMIERRKAGLHRAYGPGAAEFGGELLPPSVRAFYAEHKIKIDPDTGEILDTDTPTARAAEPEVDSDGEQEMTTVTPAVLIEAEPSGRDGPSTEPA